MRNKKMRQRMAERDNFTENTRNIIAAKSEFKCAHCGKKAYWGYGASIDHFVPLNQGGTNNIDNLIMLCKDCNKEKGEKVVLPQQYCKFLKDDAMDTLVKHFKQYLRNYEYVSRKNLLCCDEYEVHVETAKGVISQHFVKRATVDDIDRILEYYAKYLKKYGVLDGVESAKLNILFWLKFGCIYYVEKNNEIKVMAAVTVTDLKESRFKDTGIANALSVTIFAYYDTDYSLTLADGICKTIPRNIMCERGLDIMPVRYNVLRYDKLAPFLFEGLGIEQNTNEFFLRTYYIERNGKSDLNPVQDEELVKFFEHFTNVDRVIDKWIKDNHAEEIKWMKWELNLRQPKEVTRVHANSVKSAIKGAGEEIRKQLLIQK